MFIVMRVLGWELEDTGLKTINVTIDSEKKIGFLPIYKTREDALGDYPDGPIREIRWANPNSN